MTSITQNTQPTLVQVCDLALDYTGSDAPVFQKVNFEITSGNHLALLGPSGCGKSSLLRLLCGLESPSDGEIIIQGRLSSDSSQIYIPPHQRSMGMVFQELALWPNLSALENVMLGMPHHRQTKQQRMASAREALASCRLDGLEKRKPAELSIGQQQRVALARALAPRPPLLLLDEPFTGLDLPLKADIFSEIRQLVSEFNLTLLLVTHDPSEALALGEENTQVLVLEDGKVKEDGKLSDLLNHPHSRTLQAFVNNP